jgi:5'-3' exonuclease
LRPFAQLLAVLPPHHLPSKYLMPTAYLPLVNKIIAGETELSHFYPHPNNVKIDPGEEGFKRNAKQPHQRNKRHYHYARMIMLLPFIDHQLLCDTIAQNIQDETNEEERNKVGSVKEFRYNAASTFGDYKSSLEMLPDVENSHCELVREEQFTANEDEVVIAVQKFT